MATAPFAALEARATNAVMSRLANVAAVLNGSTVPAIFDNGYALASAGPLGMASSQPALDLPTASVPASPVGLPVTVSGANYTIGAHEPDGTGMSRLMLEAA
jgi:hypothetical protein